MEVTTPLIEWPCQIAYYVQTATSQDLLGVPQSLNVFVSSCMYKLRWNNLLMLI